MKCSQCSAENPDGAKFCSKCGASLAVPVPEPEPVSPPVIECPACHAPKAEGSKFCGACGHRFEEVPPAVSAATTPSPAMTDSGGAGSPQLEATKAAPVAANETPKSNNTAIIVIIIALIALIGAGATGWYMWGKGKSAAVSAPTASMPMPGQPGADGLQPSMPGQTGQPAQAGPEGPPSGMSPQPGQPGQPGMDGQPVPTPSTQGGQPGGMPAQPGAPGQIVPGGQPQGGYGQPQQDVMPDQMTKEARRRRAQSEADVAPRRNVRGYGSIDDQYNQRAAAECPAGGGGFFCREKLRYQLCNGRWSENPPQGQTMCRKAN